MEITLANSAANATPSAADNANKSIADSFDTFLQLLTTQMQHQDPLSPMDSTKFTEQLVQFSQVEQAIATNKNLEQAISLIAAGRGADAVSYIGKTISAFGDTTQLTDSQAKWTYQFEEEVESAAITIMDDAGNVVYVGEADTDLDVHNFDWDGTDTSGDQLDDGTYTMAVTGKDANGNLVNATTFIHGTVTSVNTTADEPLVLLGKVAVPMSDILEISEPEIEPTGGSA
jgi:flagellar basal-body rod modification protein FlgD